MSEENRFGGVGWARPGQSKKYHAFEPAGRSLCAKWMYFGDLDTKYIGERGDDDCAACRRKVDALIASVNKAQAASSDESKAMDDAK